MREILFRGKRIDNGEWIQGFLVIWGNDYYIAPDINAYTTMGGRGKGRCMLFGRYYQVISETVGQFAGLIDKNGNKIFEGDILFCTHEIGMGYREFRGKVVYKAPRFFVDCGNVILTLDYDNGKPDQAIIGNIHDNPELLEDKP